MTEKKEIENYSIDELETIFLECRPLFDGSYITSHDIIFDGSRWLTHRFERNYGVGFTRTERI